MNDNKMKAPYPTHCDLCDAAIPEGSDFYTDGHQERCLKCKLYNWEVFTKELREFKDTLSNKVNTDCTSAYDINNAVYKASKTLGKWYTKIPYHNEPLKEMVDDFDSRIRQMEIAIERIQDRCEGVMNEIAVIIREYEEEVDDYYDTVYCKEFTAKEEQGDFDGLDDDELDEEAERYSKDAALRVLHSWGFIDRNN